MEDKIGQQAHNSPSVFSFFLPEYQPNGRVADAGLVAPEAQLGTAPLLVNFLNGMSSLINYGLTRCYSGFGARQNNGCSLTRVYDNAEGALTYSPRDPEPAAVVDELALLLTRGQLDANTRAVIEDAYRATRASSGDSEALRVAQKLFIASAEFHAASQNTLIAQERTPAPKQASLHRPYKAIVVLFMHGAADSYNMIVPHSGCAQGSASYASLDAEYEGVRTAAALPKNRLLPITEPTGEQPCTTFGVHPVSHPLHYPLHDRYISVT